MLFENGASPDCHSLWGDYGVRGKFRWVPLGRANATQGRCCHRGWRGSVVYLTERRPNSIGQRRFGYVLFRRVIEDQHGPTLSGPSLQGFDGDIGAGCRDVEPEVARGAVASDE